MEQLEILIVEDNPGDVFLLLDTLASIEVKCNVIIKTNGEIALKHLRNISEGTGLRKPDMIFLDVNLPGISGKEILSAMFKDRYLCTIPVVVMTTPEPGIDQFKMFEPNAFSFAVKPLSCELLKAIVASCSSGEKYSKIYLQ